MLRLEGGLEGEPQELDVRVHLLVRNLKGAGLLRRDDRLPDLAGNLLGRADGRVRDLAEDRHPLVVSLPLDRGPRPRHEVHLPFPREETALHEHRDLADQAVFERAERPARDVRREEDLANRIADTWEFRRVSGPLLEARPVRVVDVFERLHDVQRENRRFLPSHRDREERLGTAGREDRRAAERGGLDTLPAVRERPVHELLDLRLEVRGAGRLLGGQERPALVTDQRAGRMEQKAVVDDVAALAGASARSIRDSAPFRSSRRIASSAFWRSASTSERSAWTVVAWATVDRTRSMSARALSRTVRRRCRASDSFARRRYSSICLAFFFWIAPSIFVRYDSASRTSRFWLFAIEMSLISDASSTSTFFAAISPLCRSRDS